MNDNINIALAMDPTKKPLYTETVSNYIPQTTLKTLHPGLPQNINLFDSPQSFAQSLSFEKYLPIIYNLQSENPQYSIKSGEIGDSIPLFMSRLEDTNMHPYSLSPVPCIEKIPLQDFLESCSQTPIPVSRAAWAVHYYVKRNQISEKDLMDKFKSLLNRDPKMASSLQAINYPHYVEFAYELYTKNLIVHEETLFYLMNKLPASCMERFSGEILPTHSILLEFLISPEKKKEYKETLFKNRSQITESQLVQLALNPQTSEFMDNLQTENTKRRIKTLSEALSPCKLSASTHYRNLIFQSFPIVDAHVMFQKLKEYVKYDTVDPDSMQQFAMYLISSINWFHSHEEAISSTIAYLIKRLVPNFDEIEFFDYLFDNSDNSFKYRHLFFELQIQEIFFYSSFLKYITGKLYTHETECRSLLSNLPCAFNENTQQKYIFFQILNKMSILYPDNNFSEQISHIQNDIINHIDQISQMPFVFRFFFIQKLIDQKSETFDTVCSLLKRIGSLSLITLLFNKSRPEKFSVYAVSFIEQTIPIFIAHNLLKPLIQTSINPSFPNAAISELIYQHLRASNDDQQYNKVLSEFKGQLHQDSSKKSTVQQDNLRELIYKNSQLCSLHIFDLFLSVQSESDFQKVLCEFFYELLSFPLLAHDLLLNFFIAFCESQSIQCSSPSQQFIDSFLKTIQINTQLVQADTNSFNVIMSFLTYQFQSGFISPSKYLKRVFNSRRKSNSTPSDNVNLPLIDLFFKIIEENDSIFPVETILSEEVVKDFNEKDKNLFQELLTRLKRCPPPVITDHLMKQFPNDSSTNFAAAYYSLLPDELINNDLNIVFGYFVENVSRTTSTFWTLWLRQMVNYNAVFPISPKAIDKSAVNDHVEHLIDLFSNAILIESDHLSSEKIEILLNCWNLLCFDDLLSRIVSTKTSDLIKHSKLILKPIQFDYMHPILNRCSSDMLDQICDNFCKIRLSNQMMTGESIEQGQLTDDDYILIKLASLAFITFAKNYFDQMTGSIQLLKDMIDQLFEFMNRMYKDENCQTDIFVIDSFNYIITRTSLFPKSTDYMKDLHEYLFIAFDNVCQDIRCHLIVNMLMQQFKSVPDPLFYDLPPTTPYGGMQMTTTEYADDTDLTRNTNDIFDGNDLWDFNFF